MASTESEPELGSELEEVFSQLTHTELEIALVEMFEKSQKLQEKNMKLKRIHVGDYGANGELIKEKSCLK